MELRHLRYFVAVADTENVSRAALKLHVSQPALSRQIRDLEEELGLGLFERSAKSIRLTDAGRRFLVEARAVLDRAAQAVDAARVLAATGRQLHVGYAPSPSVRLLPPTLRAFQSRAPKARVKLYDMSTEEMVAAVREGRLQVAIMVQPSRGRLRGLRFQELARDTMCLAVPPGHPFARMRSVPVVEAAKQPLVAYSRKDFPEYHEFLERLFASVKSKPRVAEEHDSAASLVAAVEAGCGVALVPQTMACSAGPRLKLLPLSPPPEALVIGALSSADGRDALAELFVECATAAGQQPVLDQKAQTRLKPLRTADSG